MKKLLFYVFLLSSLSCLSQNKVVIDSKIYTELNKAIENVSFKKTAQIVTKNNKIAVYKTSDIDEGFLIEFIVKDGELISATYEFQGAQSFEFGRIIWYKGDVVRYSSITDRYVGSTSVYLNGKEIYNK